MRRYPRALMVAELESVALGGKRNFRAGGVMAAQNLRGWNHPLSDEPFDGQTLAAQGGVASSLFMVGSSGGARRAVAAVELVECSR